METTTQNKLNYLKETKSLMKAMLNSHGASIDDTIPFRKYIDVMNGILYPPKVVAKETILTNHPIETAAVPLNTYGQADKLYKVEDEFGPDAYVFRGNVDTNYVSFAGFYWRIVRINGNGSIRLIYDGTQLNSLTTRTLDRFVNVKTLYGLAGSNAYIGYMFGDPDGITYEATHANINDSEVKKAIDTWYEENLIDYFDYFDLDVGFWEDRRPYADSKDTEPNYSYGVGRDIMTYYGPAVRIKYGKHADQVTLKYARPEDYFTHTNSSYGNKALKYPIGILAEDEMYYAGLGVNTTTSSGGCYLTYTPSGSNNSTSWWINSPFFHMKSAGNYNGAVNYANGVGGGTNIECYIRPVINLKSSIELTGTGTIQDPYVVVTE